MKILLLSWDINSDKFCVIGINIMDLTIGLIFDIDWQC